MNCKHCSSPVNDGDKFCHECGRAVHAQPPANRRQALKQGASDVIAEGRIVTREALELGKKGLQTDTGKSVAACAAIGAAAGSAIPFVGSITGAGVGAFIGMLRKV